MFIINIGTLRMSVHVTTWNVRGLKSRIDDGNFKTFIEHEFRWNNTIILLQDARVELLPKKERQQFDELIDKHKCVAIHKGKVCTLVPKDMNYEHLQCDVEELIHRLVAIRIKVDDKQVTLVNVYVPRDNKSQPCPRCDWNEAFYDYVSDLYVQTKLLIIGGDFNTVLSKKEVRLPFEGQDHDGNVYLRDYWQKYYNNQFNKTNAVCLKQLVRDINIMDTFHAEIENLANYDSDEVYELVYGTYEPPWKYMNLQTTYEELKKKYAYFTNDDFNPEDEEDYVGDFPDNSKFLTTFTGRLDYIFASSDFYIAETDIDDKYYGSDHKPYYADLRLKPIPWRDSISWWDV